MKEYKIPYELAQKIIQYLATKPYCEVHEIMPALLKLEEIRTGYKYNAEAHSSREKEE